VPRTTLPTTPSSGRTEAKLFVVEVQASDSSCSSPVVLAVPNLDPS
jgi:hypothetical protein